MACSPEIWSLKDLSDALNNKHKDGKKIAVPMFQRGARGDDERKDGKVYWSAYRPEVFSDVEECSDINVCYVFADDLRVVTVSRKFLLEHLDEMPKSEHEDGTAHWHIKLKMFNADGKVKLMVGPQKSHNFVEMVNVV